MKFIAMNRCKIVINRENDFENIWAKIKTHLNNVSGFIEFHLEKRQDRRYPHFICFSLNLGIKKRF